MTVSKQIWCMSAVYLMSLSTGLMTVASFEVYFNIYQLSSFTTWRCILTIMGFLTSSALMDVCGRQSTYILGILPGLVSCLLIKTKLIEIEILGRALSGFSFGATSILGLIIIGEYTSPKHRSIFLSATMATLYIGNVLGKILSSYLQWTTIVNISLILQILSLGITLTWPKSPYWLALKGRLHECEASFDYLRGTGDEVGREKKDLLNRNRIPTSSVVEKIIVLCKVCVRADFRRSVTVVVFGSILAEASGRNYWPLFADDIVATVSNEIPSNDLYVNFIIAVSSLCSCILLGIFSIRKILMTSGVVSVVIMFFASVYVLLSMSKVVQPSSSWICVWLIIFHLICSNLGATTIPTVLIGEVFPLEYKAIGTFVAGVVTSTVSWGVLNMASSLMGSFQVYGTLGIFGLMVTISLLFLVVILPDTNGRTLMDIEEYFSSGWWFGEDKFDGDDERLTEV